jgi:hypothetical protein
MNKFRIAAIAMGALLMAAPAFAQTPATKQKTQDGNSPTTVGPASKAGKAYKQPTQGLPPGLGPQQYGSTWQRNQEQPTKQQ